MGPVRQPFDQAVLAEPPQVVGGLPGGDGAWWPAEVFGEELTQVFVEEPAGVQPEHQQDVHERLGAWVGEPQPGGAGSVVVDDGVAGRMQDAGSGDGVMAESLGGQEPPVGGVADLLQDRQVSRLPTPKSRVWFLRPR
ncbi:MAG: hypothetical protein ACM3ML_08370 [Micromonosporaceae bacterium]